MSVSAIQWNGLTHVVQAFALVNADGTLDLSTNQVSSTAAALVTAAHTNNVKALLSIIQSSNPNLQNAVTNHLSGLVSNIMSTVSTYGYDGVDIDWEPFSSATNGTAMIALKAALRTALGSNLLTTTIGVPETWWGSNYSYFDRLNVMTYDQSGTYDWYQPYGAWYNSALYCNYPDSAFGCVDRFAKILLTAGIPANKLGIGIPFYGYKWQGGVLNSDHSQGISGPRQPWQTGNAPTSTYIPYSSVLPLITSSNYTWDPVAIAPYVHYLGSTPSSYSYLTYDNPQSIQAKVQYAIAQGLGGWIIWELNEDYMPSDPNHPHPLLDAVQAGSAPAILSASALGSGTPGTAYSVSLSATGAAPLHWALSRGSLPNGLSLSSVGVISGTPTTAGTFTFIVTVGNFAGSASQSFTITIATSAK
jgi:chitinase